MSKKKYEFTGKTMSAGELLSFTNIGNELTILHEIRAVRDFGNVKAGERGGWIEKEENLSHDGNAWVGEWGAVYENARVYENAVVDWGEVCESAQVYGHAYVHGPDVVVAGNARVYGHATVYDGYICDNAKVHGRAWIADRIMIDGNKQLDGRRPSRAKAAKSHHGKKLPQKERGKKDQGISLAQTRGRAKADKIQTANEAKVKNTRQALAQER